MKSIKIYGQSSDSLILISESLSHLPRYVQSRRAVIITDYNVSHFYRKDFPPWDVIEIGMGEGIKTLDTVKEIYNQLLELEVDRSCFLVGIGGGIVCDIVGYVASTYMRGLSFGFVSSTLLSQVDASVGGKNGVNFYGYKNMIGVFNQPEFVICDLDMLKTLPQKERLCGFAEIVKHAAIRDALLFEFLEKYTQEALALERFVIERLVYDSVQIKASIVQQDEKEKGLRRLLNFGHTYGHALEKTLGISHGEAVGIGMNKATNLSVQRGLLKIVDKERIEKLLQQLQLPTEIDVDKKKIWDAFKKDKKREGRGIHFILLNKIGEALVQEIPLRELEEIIE